jgi:outer membrane immunogenic protein
MIFKIGFHRPLTVSLAAAGLIFGCVATASAADIAPAPVYVKAPAAVPFSWTGFYIGGNAGLAQQSASGTSDFLDSGAAALGFSSSNPTSFSPNSSGFIGGAQVGYNWQVAPNWVLGVEGDWESMKTKYNFCRQTNTSSVACIDNSNNIFGFESIGSQSNWLATARGRVGVALDRVMVYGTGGAAWTSIQTTESLSCLDDGCGSSTHALAASSTVTQTKAGWVAGVGAEGMLDRNWSIKAEWLHADFGNLSNTFSVAGSNGGVASTQTVVWKRDETFDIFRVGVNYKLF